MSGTSSVTADESRPVVAPSASNRNSDPHTSPSPPRVLAHSLTSSSSSLDTQKLVLALPIPAIDKSHPSLIDILHHDVAAATFSDELKNAEITMAADKTFAETPSGQAALELKRWLDQEFGVNETVRTPYAITSFTNQHGKQIYRVGWRDAKAPASATDPDIGFPSTATQSSHPKRRSRMSAILHSSMFNKGSSGSKESAQAPNNQESSRSPPPKKLRKSRSNSDIHGGYSSSGEGRPDTPSTGRVHSNSVGGADRPQLPPGSLELYEFYQAPPPPADVFQEIMRGSSGPTSPQNSSVHSFNSNGIQTPSENGMSSYMSPISTTGSRFMTQPFGEGISFDGPQPLSPYLTTPTPPALRVMQSFESGLTARADPESSRSKGKQPMRMDEVDIPSSAAEEEGVKEGIPSALIDTNALPEAPATSIGLPITRWDTKVFDVLQTYRGLPLPDKLSEQPVERTIKLSLSGDNTAPHDDPRFIIWGELDVDGLGRSHTLSQSSMSAADSDGPNESSSAKIIVAATIERWIAQLTSKLDYDELLIFFLTYRTYVSPVDLCQLLMCRFQWALQQTTSQRDESVKKIVRVRTFVAFRFWLGTFFVDDFIPDRDLRLLMAHWLNTLVRDPAMANPRLHDALALVKRLRKIVKDCQNNHLPPKPSARKKSPNDARYTVLGDNFAKSMREHGLLDDDSDIDLDFDSDLAAQLDRPPLANFRGDTEGFQSAANGNGVVDRRPSVSSQLFQPLHTIISQHRNPTSVKTEALTVVDIPNALFHNGSHSVFSRAFVNTMGRLSRLKRVLNRPTVPTPIVACADGSAFDLELNTTTGDLLSVPGGVEHYLKMVGRASQESEQRMRGPTRLTPVEAILEDAVHVSAAATTSDPSNPVSESDLTPVPRGVDGSAVRQGSQEYIQPTAVEEPSPEKALPEVPFDAPPDYAESEVPIGRPSIEDSDEGYAEADQMSRASLASVSTLSSLGSIVEPTLMTIPRVEPLDRRDMLQPPGLARLSHEASSPPPRSPPAIPRTRNETRKPWEIDVVSIDDLELSDLSSGEEDAAYPHAPPGLKKPARRLPRRGDFEFVRPSAESVSSMGITSLRDSVQSEQSEHSVVSEGPGVGAGVEQWQLNALIDDLSEEEEEESGNGDIEAALRRLEGQIDPERIRVKTAKVNGWIRTIQDRMVNGDYADEPPRHQYDSDDSDGRTSMMNIGNREPASIVERPQTPEPGSQPGEGDPDDDAKSVMSAILVAPPGLSSSEAVEQTGLSREEAVPPTVPQDERPPSPPTHDESRSDLTPVPTPISAPTQVPSNKSTGKKKKKSSSRPSTANSHKGTSSAFSFPTPQFIGMTPVQPGPASTTIMPSTVPHHTSWILQYRAEVLIKHFSMIDRDLFINVRVLEMQEAADPTTVPEVLDWAVFLKGRLKARAAGERVNGVVALRARINLMANFVFSEILLTQPSDRPKLVAKFIRMAWKSYEWNNFNSLVAIIAGLRSDWVSKVMGRSWSKVGKWELRMFDDLTTFTMPDNDFKHIQKAVTALSRNQLDGMGESTTDSQSTTSRSRSTSESKPAALTTCIPFLGVYLSELERHWRLPDLIDPTAPNELVRINLDEVHPWSPPAHPEVFDALAPLPKGMEMEPLVNVHKQRLIAGVYKRLVDGQHLANKVDHEVDRRIHSRCLKLRGLDRPMLERVSQLYQSH